MSTPPLASPAPTSPPGSTNSTSTPPPVPSTNSTAPPPSTTTTPSPPPPVASAPPPSIPSPPPPDVPSAPPPSSATAPPPTTGSSPSPPQATASPPPPQATASPPPPQATESPPPPQVTESPPPSQAAASPPPPPIVRSPPPPEVPSSSSPPPPSRNPSQPSPPPPTTTTTPSTPVIRSPPTRTPGTPLNPSDQNSPPPESDGGGLSAGVVAGVAVGGVAVLVALTMLFYFCFRKKRRSRDDEVGYHVPPPSGPKEGPYGGQLQYWQHNHAPPPAVAAVTKSSTSPPQFMSSSGGSTSNYTASPIPPASPGLVLGFSKNAFTYEELARATNGFSDANLLGQGGFGYVHKGLLPNAKEVAVKHLKAGSGQGEREFQAEVEIISRVHHRHLVSLVGYCVAGPQRMLVYEFVPNNTLEFHLHENGRPVMEWANRLKIAVGAARGLAYLHEDCHPKIIHRDIKATNILLDFNFDAKVADFGLAKLASDTDTHVSTRVMGTFGYLAPEYAQSGKLSDKSDVFSFGVVLLELITGRKPVDSNTIYMDESLVDWARPLLTRATEDGNFERLSDPRLKNDYDRDEMARMVSCAAAAVRHSAKRRPRMSQIVRALEGEMSLANLSEGVKPGHSSVYSSDSTDYDNVKYNEDIRRFRKTAFGDTSREQSGTSGEYSGPNKEQYSASNEYSGPSSNQTRL